MQGRLRNDPLSVRVETACARTQSPITLTIDSDLNVAVAQKGCHPVIFVPDMDLSRLDEDSIIDSF